jgi:hypothetical protein
MDAKQLICALETHVRAARGGWDDRRNLAKFNSLALELMASLESPRGREALGAASNWAEILYSALRHRRSFAPVHQAVLSDLERVRHALDNRAAETVVSEKADRQRGYPAGQRYHP